MRILASLTLIAALSLGTSATAMTATQRVETETVVVNADGTETVKRTEAKLVTPGEKVVYTLDFTNTKAEPASNLVLAMPVPGSIKFLEGSADRPGTLVEYSVDGGKTYASRDALEVSDFGQMRAATADDITHIRWQIAGPVAAGASDSVAFKGRLR